MPPTDWRRYLKGAGDLRTARGALRTWRLGRLLRKMAIEKGHGQYDGEDGSCAASSLLAASVALFIAARLIEAVLPVLMILGGIASFVYVIVLIVRSRRDEW
jgi:hypothetical protein